jgi:hypothetical protein
MWQVARLAEFQSAKIARRQLRLAPEKKEAVLLNPKLAASAI